MGSFLKFQDGTRRALPTLPSRGRRSYLQGVFIVSLRALRVTYYNLPRQSTDDIDIKQVTTLLEVCLDDESDNVIWTAAYATVNALCGPPSIEKSSIERVKFWGIRRFQTVFSQ